MIVVQSKDRKINRKRRKDKKIKKEKKKEKNPKQNIPRKIYLQTYKG